MTTAYHSALAYWQNALREILSDYVNGSYLRRRVKWVFPFAWGLSSYAVEHARHKLVYATYRLVSSAQIPALTAYLSEIDSRTPANVDPEVFLLHALTRGYQLLSQIIEQQQGRRIAILHVDREFDANEYLRADSRYFSPVTRLVRFIQQEMASDLSLAVIHGSIGDLKYAKGYSDLDTFLVLDQATVFDATRLRRFANKCYQSLKEIYQFDPLQHHGHMIATAIDLKWYSENWLPADTFRYACRITPGESKMEICVRDSTVEARRSFEDLQELMYLRLIGQWSPQTAFELKDYLSILMLAPVLYLQAKGLYVAKQDSFQLAHDRLPNATWDAVQYASQARHAWPHYQSHLGVLPLNEFWLNSFQYSQVRKAYQSTLESFPAACLGNAARLTEQMADDVEQSAMRFHAFKQARDDADLPLFIVNHPLVREARDYEEVRERYVASVQQERAVLGGYQYGNITYPGLSDLDLVLCVSETVGPSANSRLTVEALSLLDQNVMLHSPMIIPASQIPYIHEFLIDANLQKIGETQDLLAGLPASSVEVKAYAQLAKLFETVFSYRVWISEVLIQQTLDARWAIPSLKSVVYSCNIMESISGESWPWAAGYRAAIQDLRANWFLEESQFRQNVALRVTFRHGLQVVVDLISEFDNFVLRSGWLTNLSQRPPAPAVLPTLNATITFGEKPVGDVNQVIKHPRQIYLPSTFGKILNFYTQAVNNLDHQDGAANAQSDFEVYLQERVKRIAQQARFLKQHHMNFGGYLPGQLEQLLGATRQ